MKQYSEKFDAYYDDETGEWLETKCDDPTCEYCVDRPDKAMTSPDRITSLMLRAGYAAPELAGRAKKFAELLVRDCSDLIATRDPRVEPAPEIYILKAYGYE